MTAPIHTRPFCAEHARAGALYSCRNGEEATVLKWDCRDKDYPLIGVQGITDTATEWHADGGHYIADHCLVMLPLGEIDGKPVFVGDELVDPSGATLMVRPSYEECLSGCRWPEPAKAHPQTQMTDTDLIGIYWQPGADFVSVANAAIRHACESGQVVTKEDHEAALLLLRDVMTEVRNGNAAIRDAVTDRIRAFLKGQP